jgi:hypothetical protein
MDDAQQKQVEENHETGEPRQTFSNRIRPCIIGLA